MVLDGTWSVYDDTGWYLVSMSWYCLVLGGTGSAKGLYACIQGARTDEPGSSIAKDLIDSEDPKHTLFCRETAFVAIYALFQG